MKVIFAGSPEAARLTLELLYNNQKETGFEIAGVITNPDTAKGRHKTLTPTPVAEFAQEKGIPVFKPEHLKEEERNLISPLKADLLISFAYGHIFGPKFLALFPMGGINLHPSMLPKYRGCTPVQAAILNREEKTAVTIQKLALKMDEGNILSQKVVELNGTETYESLLNYSAQEGASLIIQILKEAINNGKLPEGTLQNGEASYTGIIKKEDGKINWNENVLKIEARIRALYPDPGCWVIEKGLPLKILGAHVFNQNNELITKFASEPNGKVVDFLKNDGIIIKTADGLLSVTMLQRQGKKAMNYKDFMNGTRDFIGTVLE